MIELRDRPRPATAGTLIVLATAFAMASFAMAAWSVTSANFERVARAHNGADSVLTVNPDRAGGAEAFAKAVERADPSGRHAAPVMVIPGPPKMIATDPERFAHVAHWDPAWAGRPLADLAARLRAGTAPRILLTGDRIRMRIRPVEVPKGWRARMFMEFRVPGEPKGGTIPLGAPDRRVLEWGLPLGCRTAVCELRGIRGDVSIFAVAADVPDRLQLDILAGRIEVRTEGRWHELDAGLTDPARWRGTGTAGDDGLNMHLVGYGGLKVEPATYPERIPVLANGPLVKDFSPGLDQAYLVKSVPAGTTAALPGHDEVGSVVDLDLADRVAYSIHPSVTYQVWVAPGRLDAVRAGLAAQGIPSAKPRTVGDLVAEYTVAAPGLALMLLVLATPAAAALALGRAVLALYAAARRRRYELSALAAAGARGRALRTSLLLEQLITLIAGTLAGMVAGIAAARLALPHIPEFTRQPITPPLLYEASPAPLAAVIGAALLAALLAAAITAEVLMRGIRVEQLRQAPA